MFWVYLLFFGSVILAIGAGGNPVAHAGIWILGVIIGIHQLRRFGRARQRERGGAPAASVSGAPAARATTAGAKIDMLHGLRGWDKQQCPAEVAAATCSLHGRGDAYLRSLLVMASLRDDEPGRVVSAAARRLLTRAA